MRRREFITLIAGVAAVWSSRAHTQQLPMPTIGWLYLGSELSVRQSVEGFRSGLADLGYAEGENIRVLYRYADGNAERLSTLAGELVSLGAKIIVTASTTSIRAAHNAVPNVPIVSWASGDPVMMGWAQTLAKPGGMITGLFILSAQQVKPFELLKELLPNATTFGYLMNASNPGNPYWRRLVDDTARTLGIKVEIIELTAQFELADAFTRMRSLGVEGVAFITNPVLNSKFEEIAELARLHKLPSVGDDGFVSAGGLLAFDPNYVALAKRSASFVDRILKGAAYLPNICCAS